MPRTQRQQRHGTAYAGLDFIKAAFCPLEFNAMPLKEHAHWSHLGRDKALAVLEVSEPLVYPRQFPYTDRNGHRKVGTQVVTATFGLAPKDFDMFLGLYTYLKRLPELPADGRTYLTVDFLARQLGLPADGQASYLRIRSRIFRFSYVKYTNSAFWNRDQQSYDIRNFGFYNVASMSRMTESRRPITFEWDRSFLEIVRDGTMLTFDYELYCTLSPAMRRLYLIANRDGWNQRDSGVFLADDFAIHQIGYDEKPELQKMRLFKLRKLHRGGGGPRTSSVPTHRGRDTSHDCRRDTTRGSSHCAGVADRHSEIKPMTPTSECSPTASRTTHSMRRCKNSETNTASPVRPKHFADSSHASVETSCRNRSSSCSRRRNITPPISPRANSPRSSTAVSTTTPNPTGTGTCDAQNVWRCSMEWSLIRLSMDVYDTFFHA